MPAPPPRRPTPFPFALRRGNGRLLRALESRPDPYHAPTSCRAAAFRGRPTRLQRPARPMSNDALVQRRPPPARRHPRTSGCGPRRGAGLCPPVSLVGYAPDLPRRPAGWSCLAAATARCSARSTVGASCPRRCRIRRPSARSGRGGPRWPAWARSRGSTARRPCRPSATCSTAPCSAGPARTCGTPLSDHGRKSPVAVNGGATRRQRTGEQTP